MAKSKREQTNQTLSAGHESWQRITQLATELATLPETADLPRFITQKLKEFTGAAFVSFGTYLPESKQISLLHVETESSFLTTFRKISGIDTHSVLSPVDEETYARMCIEKIGYCDTLTEVTFGAISPVISTALQKVLGWNRFIGIVYIYEDNLYGTSVLGFRNKDPEPPKEFLTAAASLISVTIRRWKADQERQKTNLAFNLSEEKFRTIFEGSTIGIELYDVKGILVTANKASFDIFGIQDDSSLGFNLFQGTSLNEELKQKLRNGETINYQATFDFDRIRELGQYHSIRTGQAVMEYVITPLTTKGKEVLIGYLLQVQEITERRKSETIQKILYNISNAVVTTRDVQDLIGIIHEQLRVLVDTTNFYVAFYDESSGMLTTPYTKDEKDSFTSWPAAKSMTGYVIMQDKSMLITQKDFQEMVRLGILEMIGIPAACWLGVPLHIDGKVIGAFVMQSYDNPQAYSMKDMEIMEFVSGQISLSIQRKQTEEKLRQNEERFRNLTDTATDGIIAIDAERRITFFNKAAEHIFGYSANEIIFQMVDVIIPEDYRPRLKSMIRHLQTGKSRILGMTFEIKGERKGGEIFPVELSVSKVMVKNETNFIGIIRDITERKKEKEELEKSTKELQESNAAKDKFFSIIAHDLKSPFNSILGLTNVLIEDYQSFNEKEIEKTLTAIKISSERAFELLENLLVWANSQTGRITFNPREFNLKIAIDEIIMLVEAQAARKKIRIISSCKEDCPAFGDNQMIQTVIRNLVSNAIKFTPPGGEITVSITKSDNHIEVSVKDTGTGIAADDIQKLFRIETKYSTRGTENETGTGLGLILCKEFIEKHGGKIWVESEEGKGSTFIFTLFLYEGGVTNPSP